MNEKGGFGRIGAHVRANVLAYVALFVALSGIAYAGVKPLLDKKGSVDSGNIRNGSVSRKDLGGGSVGNAELTAKLKRKLGLATDVPADGTYSGTGTDEVSGEPVTFITSWQKGQPTSANTTSGVEECTSPSANGFEQLGPGSWTATGKTATQELVASMQVLGPKQIVLTNALVTNFDKSPCKLEMVGLQPES